MAKLGEKFLKAQGDNCTMVEDQRINEKNNFQTLGNLTKNRQLNQKSVMYMFQMPEIRTHCEGLQSSETIKLEARFQMLQIREDGTPTARLYLCTIEKYSAAGAKTETENIVETCGAGSLVAPEIKNEQTDRTIYDCIKDNRLMLANGKSINLEMNTYLQKTAKKQMPVTTEYVGQRQVSAYVTLGEVLWW